MTDILAADDLGLHVTGLLDREAAMVARFGALGDSNDLFAWPSVRRSRAWTWWFNK